MRFVPRPYTSIQVAFRAFGLHTIFGIDATRLVFGLLEPAAFDATELDEQLRQARDVGARIALLQEFLERRLAAGPPRDEGIENVIAHIEAHPSTVTVRDLLDVIHTSERQLQRRFAKVVGGTPKQYIRVKRVNEALRLIRSGNYGTLADVAHALNYFDQSHFIRDLRELSWATPRSLAQRVTEFHHDAGGASYEEGGFSQFVAAPPP
nr:helix-turn-helix transcriptional regulator [Demequina sp. TTPB684]